MKTEVFPINYFKSIWTPIKAFVNRFKLSWPNMIVVFIFLNALMTIPVTMNFAQMDTFPIEDLYPNAAHIIENEELDELNEAEYQNGEMQLPEPFIYENEHGIVASGLDPSNNEQLADAENVVLFEQDQFRLKEKGAPTAIVPYTENFSLADAENSEDIMNELSRQWFVQNQVFLVAFFTLIIAVIQLVMLLFIVFGSALFLYFTKDSPITSITTYKESVNLLLNVISLPTIVAMVFGLVSFNIIAMSMIQLVGLVAMLLVIYFKIQFNDDNIEMKNS